MERRNIAAALNNKNIIEEIEKNRNKLVNQPNETKIEEKGYKLKKL